MHSQKKILVREKGWVFIIIHVCVREVLTQDVNALQINFYTVLKRINIANWLFNGNKGSSRHWSTPFTSRPLKTTLLIEILNRLNRPHIFLKLQDFFLWFFSDFSPWTSVGFRICVAIWTTCKWKLWTLYYSKVLGV